MKETGTQSPRGTLMQRQGIKDRDTGTKGRRDTSMERVTARHGRPQRNRARSSATRRHKRPQQARTPPRMQRRTQMRVCTRTRTRTPMQYLVKRTEMEQENNRFVNRTGCFFRRPICVTVWSDRSDTPVIPKARGLPQRQRGSFVGRAKSGVPNVSCVV